MNEVNNHVAADVVLSRAAHAGPSGRVGLPGVLAEAVLYSGFVGLATHYTQRLEVAAKVMPPYDEFRLLEESWKSMRIVVEVRGAHATSFKTSPGLRGDGMEG